MVWRSRDKRDLLDRVVCVYLIQDIDCLATVGLYPVPDRKSPSFSKGLGTRSPGIWERCRSRERGKEGMTVGACARHGIGHGEKWSIMHQYLFSCRSFLIFWGSTLPSHTQFCAVFQPFTPIARPGPPFSASSTSLDNLSAKRPERGSFRIDIPRWSYCGSLGHRTSP